MPLTAKLKSAKFFSVHVRMVIPYHTAKFKSNNSIKMSFGVKSPNLMTSNISGCIVYVNVSLPMNMWPIATKRLNLACAYHVLIAGQPDTRGNAAHCAIAYSAHSCGYSSANSTLYHALCF